MANNEFNAKGRRMVYEEDIAKIGEGGSDITLHAGTGISITTGETAEDKIIAIDTETVAVKSDITAVAANTGATPSATLTDIQVGETVYSVGGGSSVSIDEETIVEDSVSGKIKTAVGGWEEKITHSDLTYTLESGGSDWDLSDSSELVDKITELFNLLEKNVEYDVTLTFTGTTVPLSIERSYVKSSSKTDTKYGGSGSLHIVDSNNNTHSWEFYVESDGYNGRIHVWPSDSWVSPTNGSTLEIAFDPITETTYHKIDKNYIPDVTSLITPGYGLKYEDGSIQVSGGSTAVDVGMVFVDLSSNRLYSQLKYDEGQFYNASEEKNFAGYQNILKSSIDGGYKTKFSIDTSLITQSSEPGFTSMYETSQSDLILVASRYVINNIKENYSYLIVANATFDYTLYNGIKFVNNNAQNNSNWSFEVNVANDGNTVTLTGSTADGCSMDTLVYAFDTSEITTLPSCIYLTTNVYNITQGSNPRMEISSGVIGGIVNPIDAKFIPIDGSSITIDGNGKLTASGGGSSYTAGNGIYINSGTNEISVYSTNMDTPAYSLSIAGMGTSASDQASPNSKFALGRLAKSTATGDSYGSLDMFAYKRYGTSYSGITDNCAINFWAAYSTNSWRQTGYLSASGESINLRNKVTNGSLIISNDASNQGISMFGSGIMRIQNGSNNIINVPQASGTMTINLPECPTTTDGTYVLEATVSSGVVTYNWVLKQ